VSRPRLRFGWPAFETRNIPEDFHSMTILLKDLSI
jgi:hypothetical protein